MTHHQREPEDTELDLFDASLQGLFQRQASSTSDEAAATSIWNSMQAELHREAGNGSTVEVIAASSKKDYFSYRNILTLAAVGLVVSVGSMFLVAAKQRRDGTVLSTVTHVERVMRRDRSKNDTQHEWLPEERQIWRQLMEQTADGIQPDSTVAVEQARQK